MITQTLIRCFNSLFAWWPWKRSPRQQATPTSHSLKRGALQETPWYTTTDTSSAQATQSGISSVAIEQLQHDDHIHASSSDHPTPISEHPEQVSPATDVTSHTTAADHSSPTPPQEQHLEFLRFLVRRGVFHEDFPADHVPDQYKHTH